MTTTTYSNRKNTLRSSDPTITLPAEILIKDGRATAVYEGEPDEYYATLDALCADHWIDAADVLALEWCRVVEAQ